MVLEIGLLIVDFLLLIISIILIWQSRKEMKSRDAHLEAMVTVTEKLTRKEYFQNINDLMTRAQQYFYSYVTFKKHGGEDDPNVSNLLKVIETKSKQIEIRYLAPKERNSLKMGYLNISKGAEVRFHAGLLANDLRFSISDDICSVIGIPSLSGGSKSTHRSIKIRSKEMTIILKGQFDVFWKESISYQDYLKQVIEEIGAANPNHDDSNIAEYLSIPVSELEKITTEKHV